MPPGAGDDLVGAQRPPPSPAEVLDDDGDGERLDLNGEKHRPIVAEKAQQQPMEDPEARHSSFPPFFFFPSPLPALRLPPREPLRFVPAPDDIGTFLPIRLC